MSLKDPKTLGDFLWIVFLIIIAGVFISFNAYRLNTARHKM